MKSTSVIGYSGLNNKEVNTIAVGGNNQGSSDSCAGIEEEEKA